MAADSWTAGVAAALTDIGGGLVEEMEAAQLSVDDLRHDLRAGGPAERRRLYDADRPARLAALARAWRHHHGDDPVPELQLELFIGAMIHAIDAALRRGEVEDLAGRLPGLTVLAPMAGA